MSPSEMEEETQKEKPVYTEEEKERLKNNSVCKRMLESWNPDPKQNSMAYLMKECIQRTIDKFA